MLSLLSTSPFKLITPEFIPSKPAKHFKNVVLPEPLSPINEIISPLFTEKLNFSINGSFLL